MIKGVAQERQQALSNRVQPVYLRKLCAQAPLASDHGRRCSASAREGVRKGWQEQKSDTSETL